MRLLILFSTIIVVVSMSACRSIVNTETRYVEVHDTIYQTEIKHDTVNNVALEKSYKELRNRFSELSSKNPRFMFEPKKFSERGYNILYQQALVGFKEKRGIILFLHGTNGKGKDNKKPLELEPGPSEIVKYLVRKDSLSYYVLVPQLASGNWSAQCEALKSLIDKYIEKDNSIDKSQIYVCGTSLGGGGTWSMLQKYPNFFRGAMPVAMKMSGTPSTYKGTRICYVTGAAEGNRQQDADALKNAGVEVKYWFRKDANHGWTCQSSFTKECLDWLFNE